MPATIADDGPGISCPCGGNAGPEGDPSEVTASGKVLTVDGLFKCRAPGCGRMTMVRVTMTELTDWYAVPGALPLTVH